MAAKLNQLKIEKELQSRMIEVSSPLADELTQFIINKNIETCKKYQFEEGSELFFQCILALIKTEDSEDGIYKSLITK